MSAREFKPGDVALIEAGCHANRRVAIRTGVPTNMGWAYSDTCNGVSTQNWTADTHGTVTVIRPLVVIDPEGNPEGLPYLVPQHFRNYAATLRKHRGPVSARMLEWLAERLEEYVPKPRIEEPTGLGAVAETSDGDLYVRDKTTTTVAHWKRARGEDRSQRYRWTDLNVVRVLSEGVTS